MRTPPALRHKPLRLPLLPQAAQMVRNLCLGRLAVYLEGYVSVFLNDRDFWRLHFCQFRAACRRAA